MCVCVCLSVTDVTHFRNVYSGNEATTYTVARTLGTSLNWCMPWSTMLCQARLNAP